MLIQRKSSILQNEKGMAIFEMIPILVVIVLFVNFSLGFFGAIHTGILNSIASRNYAFETFRNRSNLVYFRADNTVHFDKLGARVHGTLTEKAANSPTDEWRASTRLIDFMNFERRAADAVGTAKTQHSKLRELPNGRVSEGVHQGVNPIWIKTMYGICLNASCGT